MIATTTGEVSLAALLGRFRERLGLGGEAIARRRRMAQITRELDAHSDHELAGLGIARCDIRRIARRTVSQSVLRT